MTGARSAAVIVAMVAAALLAAPHPARAADHGGVANPATACPNGYTVVSADIRDSRGFVIGRVDLRWAYSCGGNWARTTSYVGNRTLESRVAPDSWFGGPGAATSTDYNVTQNWSFYISRLPSAPACAKGSVVNSGHWYSATVCSSS